MSHSQRRDWRIGPAFTEHPRAGRFLRKSLRMAADEQRWRGARFPNDPHILPWEKLGSGIPGKFDALPTTASAMYAPEPTANSDEMKLGIED